MGVPKFYRWISERYPKINQIISDTALLPEFDHLYLDMNGIIHGCTHPPDLDALQQQALTEREMMLNIMHYLDRIITQIVKPKVSVYMAIDGVAPRAKLNQQRSRRYRSAKDMQEQEEARKLEAQKNNKNSNNNNDDSNNNNGPPAFDSNCITPGTEFLHKVSECIRFFIQQKIQQDPLWQDLTVIFSGHDIPGEGEHKIMDHIRQMRSSQQYQPNTRHVIYGQDADLIMLGLVTHEPHFTILRETVNFNSFKRGGNNANNTLQQVQKFTKESDFQLLHLSVLREYLAMEFGAAAVVTTTRTTTTTTTTPESTATTTSLDNNNNSNSNNDETREPPKIYDLERCIDDFVFMTFLVGNDFLPHLPALDIGDGAFDMLFSIYKEQRVSWSSKTMKEEGGCYLTNRGEIANPERLQGFISAIGELEMSILAQKKKDDAVFLKKKRKWEKRDNVCTLPSDEELHAMEQTKQMDYQTMIDAMLDQYGSNPDCFVEGWKQLLLAAQADEDDDNDDETGEKGRTMNPQPASNSQPTPQEGSTNPKKNNTTGIAAVNNNGNTTATTQEEEDVKGRYYFEKLNFKPIDKEKHWQLRKSYMEGLMWCLAYYYKGCISWSWYYPYHYGPMLSDLVDIPEMFSQISFDMGQPLAPFEQLMACLPPGSVTLVPKLYQWLMVSPQSPIIHFYPQQFQIDMNGKKNPWEGVNLLPFIDVHVLKQTIAEHCPDSKLSAVELRRNTFGKVYAYRYDESASTGVVKSPNPELGLEDLNPAYSTATVVEEPTTRIPPFQPVLIPGTKLPYPGFPSLTVLPIASHEFVPIGLNCFGTPSKYPTCVLTLERMATAPAALPVLAKAVLGKSLFVNWPMMHEARAVALSDVTQEIRLVKPGAPFRTKAHSEAMAERWRTETELMQQMYYIGDGVPGSGGVNIGEILIRLKVLPLQGMKTNPTNGSTKKIFGREEADVPLQLALGQAPAPDPRFQERGPVTLKDRFPVNSRVVLTKGKYRGCLGKVIDVVDKKTVGVRVQTVPAEPPFGLALAKAVQETYVSSNDAARMLRIHPGVLGKIMGRLQFEPGRYDLGLNLKSPDGMCVVGYSRKKMIEANNNNNNSNNNNTPSNNNNKKSAWAVGDALRIVGSKPGGSGNNSNDGDDRIIWEYAPKAIRLVETYRAKFPQLFAGLSQYPNEKRYDANSILGSEEQLPVIREWLNNLESAKLPRSPVTTHSLSSEAVATIQKAAAVRSLALKKKQYPKELVIKIPGTALYREASTGPTDVLWASDLNKNEEDITPQLGDRIVNLAADGIPFGLRGTVVAIHEASSTTGSVEVVMDQEFMGGSTLQGFCSKFRGKLCVWSRLLKVAPDDAKSMVDRMVPTNNSRANHSSAVVIDKIMSTLDPAAAMAGGNRVHVTANVGTIANVNNKNNRNAQAATTNAAAPNQPVPAAARSKKQPKQQQAQQATMTPTTNAAGRVGSSQKGGGRQAGYREARGPDAKSNSIGFQWKGGKGKQSKTMTGISRWKTAVKQNRQDVAASNLLKSKLGIGGSDVVKGAATTTAPPSVDSAAEKLKVVLGVSGVNQPNVENNNTTSNSKSSDAVSNLKSMLGVTPTLTSSSTNKSNAASDAASDTAQLKEVLGLGASRLPVPPPPEALPPPPAAMQEKSSVETAADKLLKIMMVNSQTQSVQPPQPYMPPEGPPMMYTPSGFNFTFVPQQQSGQPPTGPPPPPMFAPYGGQPHQQPGPYHHPHSRQVPVMYPPPPQQQQQQQQQQHHQQQQQQQHQQPPQQSNQNQGEK